MQMQGRLGRAVLGTVAQSTGCNKPHAIIQTEQKIRVRFDFEMGVVLAEAGLGSQRGAHEVKAGEVL